MDNGQKQNSATGSVERCTLEDAGSRFGPAWRELLSRKDTEPSLAPEWLLSTASSKEVPDDIEVFVQAGAAGVDWLVPLLRRDIRMYGLRCTTWEAPGNSLMAYHAGILARVPYADALAAVLRALSKKADIVVLPLVVENSEMHTAVGAVTKRGGWHALTYDGVASPYVTVEGSWDAFLQSKSRNFRYTLGRKERALEKKGQLTERWYFTPSDTTSLLADMLAVEAASWKVDAGMAVSDRKVEQRYYERLLPLLAEKKALVANVLSLDAVPIAYSLCYAWNGKLGQMKTSFSEGFSELSPGLVVNHHAVRYAFENGYTEFDFLGDVMPHKTHWTDASRRHKTYYLLAPNAKMRTLRLVKTVGQLAHRFRAPQQTLGRGARRQERDT